MSLVLGELDLVVDFSIGESRVASHEGFELVVVSGTQQCSCVPDGEGRIGRSASHVDREEIAHA